MKDYLEIGSCIDTSKYEMNQHKKLSDFVNSEFYILEVVFLTDNGKEYVKIHILDLKDQEYIVTSYSKIVYKQLRELSNNVPNIDGKFNQKILSRLKVNVIKINGEYKERYMLF